MTITLKVLLHVSLEHFSPCVFLQHGIKNKKEVIIFSNKLSYFTWNTYQYSREVKIGASVMSYDVKFLYFT